MQVTIGPFGTVEVPDHYKEIAFGVGYHELPIVAEMFELARANGFSPAETVQKMKEAADNALKMVPGLGLEKARSQMDHPLFLEYIKAKLGAF